MPEVGLIFILLVCLEVILVCFNKVKVPYYPYLLYGVSAGMVLMTSLAGPYIIGSDYHLEFYYARLYSGEDVLQPIVGIPQGTSIANNLIPNLLPIPILWVYKVVYPLLFSSIPVILYFAYRKYTDSKQAFLASFLFISFPAFIMELPGIARQMTAEFILVLLLCCIYISKWKHKIYLIVLLSGLLPLFHYAVAIVTLIFLSVAGIIKGGRKLAWVSIISIIIVSSVWFPLADRGAVAIKLGHLYNSWSPVKIEVPGIAKPQFARPELAEHPPEVLPSSKGSLLKRYEILILSGFGFDLLDTTLLGKIFRILQLGLLVIGILGIWKLRKIKRYWVFSGGAVVLVVLLAVPGISNLLNITRFLHLALILLSPVLVIYLKPKYMLLILIPYFLFTSGFIFEVTKQPHIEKITIPYNVGLSDKRLDLGASTTKDDLEIAKYIYERKLFPIYSDIHGADLMGEFVGWRDDLHGALRRNPTPLTGAYVFIRSRNTQDGLFTVWNGVGCKKRVNPKEYYGIDINQNIIYQRGESRVIWVP